MYNMEFFWILPTQNILHDRSQALDYLAGPLKIYVFVKRSFTPFCVQAVLYLKQGTVIVYKDVL